MISERYITIAVIAIFVGFSFFYGSIAVHGIITGGEFGWSDFPPLTDITATVFLIGLGLFIGGLMTAVVAVVLPTREGRLQKDSAEREVLW